MKISVVTPLYKSERNIEKFHHRSITALQAAGAASYEIIFVNDGSPDESLDIAKRVAARDPSVTVIDLSRNFGQHAALMVGLARSSGDFVFILDSDLEEEPEWLVPFLSELTKTECDVVYGVNTNIKGGYIYTACRRIFYKTLNVLSSADFPENTCTARLMTRRYVDAFLQFRERELFMAGVWHMTGFVQRSVKVLKLDSSPTTYSFGKLMANFVNAVTAFSIRPLVAIFVSGIALSIVAFIYLATITLRKVLYDVAVEGWASVMSVVLIIGGISLLFNGVMAIYIAKIFIEVKGRPRSIIREIHEGTGHERPTADAVPHTRGEHERERNEVGLIR